MKCAILQPHYIPWCGYFSMIKNVDKFVFLDDVKFIKREWKNRNLIRKSPNSNFSKWLTVPILKNSQNSNINEALIDYDKNWQIEHINSITEVYRNTSFFKMYSPKIFEIINTKYKHLSELNAQLVKHFSKGFKIDTDFLYSSTFNVKGAKDEKLLNICLKIKSNHYFANNLSSKYIDESIFKKSNIHLEYQNYKPIYYDQFNNNKKLEWMSNLSIIDLLFNHGFDTSKI